MTHATRFLPAIGLAIGTAVLAACSGMMGRQGVGASSGGTAGTLVPGSGGNGGTTNSGAGGTTNSGAGGDGRDAARDAAGDAGAMGLPCDVAALLTSKCVTCHGVRPLDGVPTSLVTYADLTAPSKSNPAQANAALSLSRMTSSTAPMPPAGSTPPTAAEIAAMRVWVAAGYPMASCATGRDGGATTDGPTGTGGGAGGGTGMGPDPFAVPATCTSNVTWKGGRQGSGSMEPGMACIGCHSTSSAAPPFGVAGTLYATAHEPDLCNGVKGSVGAKVLITDADGVTATLYMNDAGSFYYQDKIATPYTAKVVYMGRERAMATAQTSGDCNSCHTQYGTMSAPGRILLP